MAALTERILSLRDAYAAASGAVVKMRRFLSGQIPGMSDADLQAYSVADRWT